MDPWAGDQTYVYTLKDSLFPLNSYTSHSHALDLKHFVFDMQPLLPVPWNAGKIVQVMFLWLFAFWVLGYLALPGGLELLGLEREELTARGQVCTTYT